MSRGTGQVEVRDARAFDVHGIQHVARMTWDHTYRETIPGDVRAEFVSRTYSWNSRGRRIESNVFLVATADEEVLAFADFRTRSETVAELGAIYVLPEMHRRGIGARVLEAGIDRFPPRTRFVLRVESDNALAQRIYQANGFTRTE